jgi:hypothetical protein
MTPIEVESKLNEALEALVPQGFKVTASNFGDEKRGCAFRAFALYANDRKIGESALDVAGRHFGVDNKSLWSAVAGFDGKTPTAEMRAGKPGHQDWYDMGARIAARWDVHKKC